MAEIKTLIKLTDKEILEILCEKFNVEMKKATIKVNHFPGNQRESEYTEFIFETIK